MDTLKEYGQLRGHLSLSTIHRKVVSDETLTTFVLNVQSLVNHINYIVYKHR